MNLQQQEANLKLAIRNDHGLKSAIVDRDRHAVRVKLYQTLERIYDHRYSQGKPFNFFEVAQSISPFLSSYLTVPQNIEEMKTFLLETSYTQKTNWKSFINLIFDNPILKEVFEIELIIFSKTRSI